MSSAKGPQARRIVHQVINHYVNEFGHMQFTAAQLFKYAKEHGFISKKYSLTKHQFANAVSYFSSDSAGHLIRKVYLGTKHDGPTVYEGGHSRSGGSVAGIKQWPRD
jgi:hypothetical protein